MIHPDLQTWLKTHPVHSFPKDPQSFWFGRWHEHRLHPSGVKLEAIKYLKARLKPRTAPQKLLIFGRPRSGTTLLGKLLAQVPGIHDEGEYLHFGHLAPLASLDNCAHSTACDLFVTKLLSYQMLEVQQIGDGYGFFRELQARGYRFIHLRRNSFDQALSLCTARLTGEYFVKRGARPAQQELRIAPQVFVAELRRNLMMLAYEDLLMSGFAHIPLQYEDNLRAPEAHQPTIDRICAASSCESASVVATLPRTGGKQGLFRIVNRAELEDAAVAEGLGHALSDHAPVTRRARRRPAARSERLRARAAAS